MKTLKLLLETFGIKIDPLEVERAWLQAKDALPQIARAYDEMNSRQKRVEEKLEILIAAQGVSKVEIPFPGPLIPSKLNGVDHAG